MLTFKINLAELRSVKTKTRNGYKTVIRQLANFALVYDVVKSG